MSIINFDCLKVTTMTVIVVLKGEAVIENIFPLLPITRLNLPPPLRPTKRFKIPYCGIPGAILSAKYSGITRGIVKSKTKQSFLNSITIDICTSKKNINVKLSGKKIQMCGADSEELSIETAEHVITHLKSLQNDVNYINSIPDIRDACIDWIKEKSRGEYHVIDAETQDIIELDPEDKIVDGKILKSDGKYRVTELETIFSSWNTGDYISEDKIICDIHNEPYTILVNKEKQIAKLNTNFFIKIRPLTSGKQTYYFVDLNNNPIVVIKKVPISVLEVNSIKIPEEYPDKYPEHLDARIINFYIRHAPDYSYHHVFSQFLDSVRETKLITTDDIGIESINMAMINYSYSLGMGIDRWALANYINGLNGFTARYCNSTDHSVTISLPYELPEGSNKVRRKNKTARHTFMVHKSGIVTQSGPNIDLMRQAYYKFLGSIYQIKHLIIQEGRSFNLKYQAIKYDQFGNKVIKSPPDNVKENLNTITC
jgi:hypothetical protein